MMAKRILKKLRIEPQTRESLEVFLAGVKTVLKYCDGDFDSLLLLDAPVLKDLGKLDEEEINYIKSELSKVDIPIETCQTRVQKLLSQETRKRFAAFYTVKQGAQFMALLAREYAERHKLNKVILADPFLGTACTLTAAIKELGAEKIKKVWGIEPLSLPALIAYAALLQATGGRDGLVTVIVGDAFKEIPRELSLFGDSKTFKADIILTNPPFTRWKYLRNDYRGYLHKVMDAIGYKKYIIRREISLQTLSMFLSDYVLDDGGLIASVLPASTFYTLYGKGYKLLLKEKYDLLAVIEYSSRASFSEDSGFKEVILAAIKRSHQRMSTVFATLDNDLEKLVNAIINRNRTYSNMRNNYNLWSIYDLPRFLDINWLSLIGKNKLRDSIVTIFTKGLENKTLGYWDDILSKASIIRGVEMYGPEFFFIPNKFWSVTGEDNGVLTIRHIENELTLNLEKKFLVKTLRKPSFYSNVIEAKVDTYMLSIPPQELKDLPSDLRTYIEWGRKSETARPAISAYGKYWYSHVYRQMKAKKPFGQIFIPDKVDLNFKNRGVFANYTKVKTAASKNFYIVKDKDEKTTKLLIAWFNSTIFISILLLLGRKISETWTRFLENDYLELPVINVHAIDTDALSTVIKVIDKILSKELPPLMKQLNKPYRYDLDLAIAKAINISNPEGVIETIYKILSEKFQ